MRIPWELAQGGEADPVQVRVMSSCVTIIGSLGIVMSFLRSFEPEPWSPSEIFFCLLSMGGMAIGYERDFFKMYPSVGATGFMLIAELLLNSSSMGDAADTSFLFYFSVAFHFIVFVVLEMILYNHLTQTNTFSGIGRCACNIVQPWAREFRVYSSYITILLMVVTAVMSFIRYLGDPNFMGDWESTRSYLAVTLCVLWISAEYQNLFDENVMTFRGWSFLMVGILIFVDEPTLGATYLALFVASIAVGALLTDIELESEKREEELVDEEPGFMQSAFSAFGDIFVALTQILLPELNRTDDDSAARKKNGLESADDNVARRKKKSDGSHVTQDDPISPSLRSDFLAYVAVFVCVAFVGPCLLKLAWFLVQRELRTTASLLGLVASL